MENTDHTLVPMSMKHLPSAILFGLLALLISGCFKDNSISDDNIPVYQIDKKGSGTQGVVSTAHPLASDVGAAILSQGGNAIDAAVAVHMTLAVVYPRAGNLGGGGFMMYRSEDGEVKALDFREMAPGLADRDMYLNDLDEIIPGKSTYGIYAVGIPGSVHGMYTAHQKYGSLPWSSLLTSAIQFAEEGHRITALEADRLNTHKKEFIPLNDDIPFIKKEKWKAGDLLIQKELASTLRLLKDDPIQSFYFEEIAEHIIAENNKRNGIIRPIDLRDYESVWREAIRITYKGHDIYSMPPPSSGGIALGQLLGITASLSDPLPDFHSAGHIHRMAEVSKFVYADRSKHLGDMDYYPVPIHNLLDKDYLDSLAQLVSLDTARSSSTLLSGDQFSVKESYETTHYSIVDKNGNAVAVTTTLNGNYGSKVYVDGAGFFLNNEMDDFSAKPGTPNMFGLIGADANAIEPGKRMLSSMTPTIIAKDGDLVGVLGSPGGSTIITTIYQIIHGMIDYNKTAEEMIEAPRYHHQWLPDHILHEDGLLPDSTEKALAEKGHSFAHTRYIGLVDAVFCSENICTGLADPRGDDDVEAVK